VLALVLPQTQRQTSLKGARFQTSSRCDRARNPP